MFPSNKYCGTHIPEPFRGTKITMKFHSDNIGTGRGFLAVVCCSVNIVAVGAPGNK